MIDKTAVQCINSCLVFWLFQKDIVTQNSKYMFKIRIWRKYQLKLLDVFTDFAEFLQIIWIGAQSNS